MVRENCLLLIDDINRMPEEFHLRPPCDIIQQLRSRSFILCPITVRDEVVGVFGVDNKLKRKKLDDTDVDTVKLFADQVSSTLIKISLLEAVETLIGELEYTFHELLKYRADYTLHDHSLRRATGSTTDAIRDIAGGTDVLIDTRVGRVDAEWLVDLSPLHGLGPGLGAPLGLHVLRAVRATG